MNMINVLLLWGVGCFIASATQPGTEGKNPQPFSIEITATKSEVKVHSEIPLRIRLANLTNHPIRINPGVLMMEGGIDPGFSYDCRDESGRVVPKDYPVMGSLGDHPVLASLNSGDVKEQIIRVDRACDLNRAGKYTIQLSMVDPNDPKHGSVKSNKLTVTVIQ
jgi:hypothetical protein